MVGKIITSKFDGLYNYNFYPPSGSHIGGAGKAPQS
jgi:hypothetical protein